jgi:3-methyladenine DNA glycosylase AlkD
MKKISKQQSESLQELDREIKNFNRAPLEKRLFLERYVGGGESNLVYLGLRIPQLRALFKKDLKVLKLPIDDQFVVFEKNWFTSNIFEQKALSLFWLEKLNEKELLRFAKPLLTWISELDNWAHADGLCGIYSKIHEMSPALYLPTYKKWNRHKNFWYRRVSMVGLIYYARARKVKPAFRLSVSLVKPHLSAKEYFVQKAVGWTLREMYNIDPEKTLNFIENNIEHITPIAWVAASEKMKTPIKQKLLAIRKRNRKKA